MLGQPAAHQLSPDELESVSPALVSVPIFSQLPGKTLRPAPRSSFSGGCSGRPQRQPAQEGYQVLKFIRAEPLVVPKRSLTNSAAERVDVRVLQVIYALPSAASSNEALFRVGQQVDAYIPARRNGATTDIVKPEADETE